MKFIKKNLELLCLGCAFLFNLLVFVCMAGTGAVAKSTLGNTTWTSKFSVYQVMTHNGQEGSEPLLIITLILVILVTLLVCALLGLKLMKKEMEFTNWLLAGGAIVMLLCAGFYLYTAQLVGNSSYHLGVGAVFCSIFGFLSFGALALPLVMKTIKK